MLFTEVNNSDTVILLSLVPLSCICKKLYFLIFWHGSHTQVKVEEVILECGNSSSVTKKHLHSDFLLIISLIITFH